MFPTDWIAASNRRSDSEWVRQTPDGPVHVRSTAPQVHIKKTRAHYTDGTPTVHRTRVANIETRAGTDWDPNLVPGRNLSTVGGEYEWIAHEDTGSGTPRPTWRFRRYEVADPTPDGARPHGQGWRQYQTPDGSTVWRRAAYMTDRVQVVHSPQIVTNRQDAQVEGVSETYAVCVHEASHRFESTVPGITKVEQQFVTRRATRPGGVVNPLQPLYADGSDEAARRGGFVDPYVGKEYASGHREVLSMGMESLFGGNFGGLIGITNHRVDLEHRAFVLGALAGLGKRTANRRDTRP